VQRAEAVVPKMLQVLLRLDQPLRRLRPTTCGQQALFCFFFSSLPFLFPSFSLPCPCQDPHFNENLLSVPELQVFWKELLGLSTHNAWECVGETDETRLAFRACAERGMTGAAMDLFREEVQSRLTAEDWQTMLDRFDRVHDERHNIPTELFHKLAPYL
jgi:hypothetical protein